MNASPPRHSAVLRPEQVPLTSPVAVPAWRRAMDWAAVPLVMLAAALLLRSISFPPSVIDWDESLYILQAREWLRGGWPLVAIWDMHPVGAPAMVSLAMLIMGESIAAVRVLGVIAVAATGTALFAMARILGAPRRVGLAAGVLYIAHTVLLGGLATNTELLFAPFTASAIALGARSMRRAAEDLPAAGWRSLAVMGLLMGWALMVKPVVVPHGCLAFALFTLPAWWRGQLPLKRGLAMAGVYAALCALPTVLMAFAYLLHGELQAFVDGSFLAPMRYAHGRIPLQAALHQVLVAVLSLGWVFALAVLGLVGWRPKRLGWASMVTGVGLLWFLCATVAIVGPGMFYGHYFLIWLAPASLLAALGAWRIAQLVQPRFAVAALLVLVPLIAADAFLQQYLPRLAAGSINAPDTPRRVAALMARELHEGEAIFVVNYQPIVYFLSGAEIPTRLAFPGHLTGHFADVADINTDAELARVLAMQPRFIVVDRGYWADVRPEAAVMITAALEAGYDRAASFPELRGPIQVWRRR